MRPKKPIDRKASEITGIEYDMDVMKMTKNKELVETTDIRTALRSFIKFLGDRTHQPILVGHNIIRFDNPRVGKAAKNCGLLVDLDEAVSLCLDTFQVFKGEYPNMVNHRQATLVTKFLEKRYDAHGAVADVAILKELVEAKLSNKQLLSYIRKFNL